MLMQPRNMAKMRLTAADLDGRTKIVKRIRQLVAQYEDRAGGRLTAEQRTVAERCAALSVLVSNAEVQRLAGDLSISLNDIVRLQNTVARLERRLGTKPRPVSRPAWAR
jgi:hypothetical protein